MCRSNQSIRLIFKAKASGASKTTYGRDRRKAWPPQDQSVRTPGMRLARHKQVGSLRRWRHRPEFSRPRPVGSGIRYATSRHVMSGALRRPSYSRFCARCPSGRIARLPMVCRYRKWWHPVTEAESRCSSASHRDRFVCCRGDAGCSEGAVRSDRRGMPSNDESAGKGTRSFGSPSHLPENVGRRSIVVNAG